MGRGISGLNKSKSGGAGKAQKEEKGMILCQKNQQEIRMADRKRR